MQCTNCGKELQDGVKFCSDCGTVQPDTQDMAAPAAEETVAPVSQEAPVAEPAAEEPAAADPAPNKPAKKKKGLIITIAAVLVVALTLGVLAIVGQCRYDEAVALLEQKQYDEALDIFASLWIFRDSADQAETLEKLQADYDAAHELIDQQKYDDAATAFMALGDYRDSQDMVMYGITYEKAMYLAECAKLENLDGMNVIESADTYANSMDACGMMLEEAARLLQTVEGYKDASEQAATCLVEAARAYLSGNVHASALEVIQTMETTAAEAFMPEFLSQCADATVLQDLEAALQARTTAGAAFKEEDFTEKKLVDAENQYLEKYTDAYFYDTKLQEYVLLYLEGLDMQEQALGTDGYLYDNLLWLRGAEKRMQAIDAMHMEYGFLPENHALFPEYVGQAGDFTAQIVIERSLQQQLWGQSAVWSNAGYYYIPYTNDTGCDFTIEVYHSFYNGETLVGEDYHSIEVSNGKKVKVPVTPPNASWEDWYLDWFVHNITIHQLPPSGVYYTLTGVEANGMVIEGDLLAQTQITASLVLYEDGTAAFTMSGTTVKMVHGDGMIWTADAPNDRVAMVIDGDQLSMEVDGAKLIFTEE